MSCIIWGFPGIGKSSASDGRYIVDADYNLFAFVGTDESQLHGPTKSYVRNPDFPDNYIEYVKAQTTAIVLINCHISLLHHFDNVVLVYPDASLKEEYLKRYKSRGDNESYLEYMDLEFERMVYALDKTKTAYKKFKVTDKNVHLFDLIHRKELKAMMMTKKDMVDLLREGKELLNSDEYKRVKCSLLDSYLLKDINDFSTYAQEIFDGESKFDFESLENDIKRAKNGIAKELILLERRGGLSYQELADKIMQGIVNGALGIRYSEIAPYSHGYEVTFGGNEVVGSTSSFKNRWECYCEFFEIGNVIAGKIENNVQNNEVFGKKCEELFIHDLLAKVEKREKEKRSTFIPEKETDFKRAANQNSYPFRNSVASVMDVHAGKGLDGIVKHHYHGTYSTYTPTKQNSLVEMLVYLNGFCLDYLNYINQNDRANIIDYLKKNGTDISTPDKLKDWITNNPDKCAIEENRLKKVSLFSQIEKAKAKKAQKDSPAAKEILIQKER